MTNIYNKCDEEARTYRTQAHPEDGQDVDRWLEDQWKGRPDTGGLESAVGERGTDVEAIEAVGQENQEEALVCFTMNSNKSIISVFYGKPTVCL